MGLSFDDYKRIKKKGLIKWDTDVIEGHGKKLAEFASASSADMDEAGFDQNKRTLGELESERRYVGTYINSLKGTADYDAAKKSFDSQESLLSKAREFYGRFNNGREYRNTLGAAAAENEAIGKQQQYNTAKKDSEMTAQEYYDDNIAGIEKKRSAATARLKELDEQYRSTKYSTPAMQSEYSELKKQVEKYDGLLTERNKVYKQKRSTEEAENDKINEQEKNKRYSYKYQNADLKQLVNAYAHSDNEGEKQWIKRKIELGSKSSDMEKHIAELEKQSDEEAKRIAEPSVYDGYGSEVKNRIAHVAAENNAKVDLMERMLAKKKRLEKRDNYLKVYANEDFEEKSKEPEENTETTYSALANSEVKSEKITDRSKRLELDNRRYMTDKEQKVYNYLYNTAGKDKAEDFIASITPELNERMTKVQATKAETFAKDNAIGASLQSILFNVASGGGIVEDVVKLATRQEVDTNSALHLPANLRNTERETVSSMIDNDQLRWLYNVTMNAVADAAANMLLTKGAGAALGAVGASAGTAAKVASSIGSLAFCSQAATSEVIEGKKKGLSDGAAVGLGVIHGIAEYVSEKYSIESILTDSSTLKKALLHAGLAEGSEEVVSNWISRPFDLLLEGDTNEQLKQYNKDIKEGKSKAEALMNLLTGFIGEDAEAFFAGAVSGVAMAGTSRGAGAAAKKISEGVGNYRAGQAKRDYYLDKAKGIVQDDNYETVMSDLINAAKNSGDEKSVKMAESFERTLERHDGDMGALQVADVANLIQVMEEGGKNVTGAQAQETETAEQTADAQEPQTAAAEQTAASQKAAPVSVGTALKQVEYAVNTAGERRTVNRNYTESGLKVSGGVNLSAFGVRHPDGVKVVSKSDPQISFNIARIESSSKAFGDQDNTIVLKTDDGRYINADEVQMPTMDLDTLIHYAPNFDTNGARGLLANYDGYLDYCVKADKKADVHEYIEQYEKLYQLGQKNVRLETVKKVNSPGFRRVAEMIGAEQAANALNTGANDVDAHYMHEDNQRLKLKMPGRLNTKGSRVIVDVLDEGSVNISDDQKNMLQAVAIKAGRDIVLTDRLGEDDNGVYKDGKIYINANMANSDYQLSVALHEAVHGMRDAAPMAYNALEKFVVNYLIEKGENVDNMLANIAENWGDSASEMDIRMEELVAQTVMALASDEKALYTAIKCEANKNLLDKVLDAIKRIAAGVKQFIRGVMVDGKAQGRHNLQAQPWVKDYDALMELARRFSAAMDEARARMEETGQKNNTHGVRHSFAGTSALTHDSSLLSQAKAMESDGKDSEEIRQKTGWFKGYDGKWRFEIDDSSMKVDLNEVNTARKPEYIGDIVENDKLFEAYPQLRGIRYRFENMKAEGYFSSVNNEIVLNSKFENSDANDPQLQKTLIHELQHAIQHIEKMASGTSVDYEYERGDSIVNEKLRESRSRLSSIINNLQRQDNSLYDDVLEVINDVDDKMRHAGGYDSFAGSNGLMRLSKLTGNTELLDAYKDWVAALGEYDTYEKSPSTWAENRYYNTAGEIEARDVADRVNYSPKQRKNTRPDIDRKGVVFADDSDKRYSKADAIDEDYLSAVERGDMETAQRMVDEAAERAFADSKVRDEDGELLKVYHGSDADFTVFDKTKGRANMDIQGMFFSPWELDASGYGKKVRTFYLNIENPASESTGYKALNRHMKENNAGVKAREDLEHMGYDGVNNEDEEYIAFNSEQIKSADPVTYDDDGKVIPLSERFNPENKDIRYSKDDTIMDDWFNLDEDLFEDEHKSKRFLDEFIKTSPQEATLTMYNSIAKIGERVVKDYKGVKLSKDDYLKIARRLMKEYHILLKHNPIFDEHFANVIEKFVSQFKENPNTDYQDALNVLTSECKGFLLLSGDYVDDLKELREHITYTKKGGGVFVLRKYERDQILENYDGWKGLRRTFMGKINIGYVENVPIGRRIYIEEFLENLQENEGFRGLITDDDIDSFAGWDCLDRLLNYALAPKMRNPYVDGVDMFTGPEQSIDSAAVEMALRILSEITVQKSEAAARDSAGNKKLIADLKKKERAVHSEQELLAKAKAQKYHRLAELERQRRQADKEALEGKRARINRLEGVNRKHRDKITALRKENREYRAAIRAEMKPIREQYVEAREKVRYRNLLVKELNRMKKMLDGKENNNAYIPTSLKKPILNVLELFEADPGEGKKLPADWVRFRNLHDVGARVEALTEEYEKLRSEKVGENIFGDMFNADAMEYSEDVKKALDYIKEHVKGKNVYALGAEELHDLYEGMRMLDSQLKKAVEIIVDGKRQNAKDLAARAATETQELISGGGNQFKEALLATHLDPVRFGRRLGGYHDDYVLPTLFRDLHEGDKKRVKIMQQAFVEIERTLTKEFSQKELKAIQTKDISEFEIYDKDTGKRVKVSEGMLLSIYLTAKQRDGYRHLVNDLANHYTVLPDLDWMNVENVNFVGQTAAAVTKAGEKARGAKRHRVRFTEHQINEIARYVESNRRLTVLADAINNVFNGLLKEEINKVTLQRYGKMIATVKDYFPIKIDQNDPNKKFETEIGESFRDQRIKSRSFTKQRTESYNAIVIDDVFKVFLRHVQESAEYCGMLIPVENFKRIYGKGNDDTTVRGAIEKKFGAEAVKYINKLMDDIQKPKNTLDQNLLTRIHGNYMGAVLFMNPGATLKQFAAYPTAFKYFGVKNVCASIPRGFVKGKDIVDKYSEYTPYMWYRENGNGTIVAEVSKQLSLTNKTNDFFDWMGKADRLVVNSLLYAAEDHVKQARKDLEFDSAEFCEEVARQFEKAVDESQPNNMITSKPQFIRNETLRILSLNAFLNQNMAMGNGIIDSYMEWQAMRREYKVSGDEGIKSQIKTSRNKFLANIIGVLLSGALLSTLKQLADLFFYHKWDDTKDEHGKTSWAKIGERWLKDFESAVTGAFAQGDFLYSVLTAKWNGESAPELEAMSLETINNIVKCAYNFDFLKLWSLIADAAGIPLAFGNSITRILKGVSLSVMDTAQGGTYPMNPNDPHTIFKNNGQLDTTYFPYYIIEYTKEGKKEEAQKYEKMWQDSGKSMDDIKNELAEKLAETDEDVTKAFVAFRNGDSKEYSHLFDKLVGYGFDSADVGKAIKNGVKRILFKDMREREVGSDDAKTDLMQQGFNENAARSLAEEYNGQTDSDQPDSAFEETGDDKKIKWQVKDGVEALKNGDRDTYNEIRAYVVNHDSGIADNAAFDQKTRSMTYTRDIIAGYLKALDEEHKTGSKEKESERKRYQEQLKNIYGNWSEAADAIKRYQKSQKKK